MSDVAVGWCYVFVRVGVKHVWRRVGEWNSCGNCCPPALTVAAWTNAALQCSCFLQKNGAWSECLIWKRIMSRSLRWGHQKKEVDVKVAMNLEVTCRQACFVDWCVQDITNLNLNFDLQWISPVSKNKQGRKETCKSQGNMTANSWWTNDRKHFVTLWCWIETSQSKHDWLVVQECGQAFSKSAVWSANQHGKELDQPHLWSWHETIEADCCDKFHNFLSFMSKLHCCNETSENNWRGSKHAKIESKFSWLFPNDLTSCFEVMWTK